MNNKIRNFIVFLLLRTPIYILLIVSYFTCIQKYLEEFKFFPQKINSTICLVFLIFVIATLVFIISISFSYYENRISEGTITLKRFDTIYKNDEDIEMGFLNSYIFPIIAGFQGMNFLWIIFYETFIFLIISKNINKYYRLFISLFFTEYVAYENDKKITFFSREKEEKIKKYLNDGEEIPLKNVDFSLDSLGKNIFIYKK
ncbi:MAG: hypothetical protein MSH33_05655 [Fusobacterium necrophorum]|nr:hypothetical protein [Fusobacterium necrophorum]